MGQRIDIIVNQRKRYRIRTPFMPDHLDELIVGYLWSKEEIDTLEDIVEIVPQNAGCMMYVTVRDHVHHPRLPKQAHSSAAASSSRMAEYNILPWFRLLRPYCGHSQTTLHGTIQYMPGTCILIKDDALQLTMTDYSWQNAMYKTIGWCILNQASLSEFVFFTMGLVTLEKIRTILSVGVSVLITEVCPTERALNMATDAGTLVVTVEPDSVTVFTPGASFKYRPET